MKYSFAPVAAFLVLVGLSAVAAAETTTLAWSVQSYDAETANVGDKVTFDFSGSGHNVFIHPSGDCDDTDAIEVGTSGPVTYTFTEDDAGKDLVFACEVQGHCEAGQFVKFTVAAAGFDTEGDDTPNEPTNGGDRYGNNGGDSSAPSTARIIMAPVMLLAALFL